MSGGRTDIAGVTAIVTGANRGLGRHLVLELQSRGARVYAAARDPRGVPVGDRITPLRMDITDPESVLACARAAGDVTVVINNAGVSTGTDLLDRWPSCSSPLSP